MPNSELQHHVKPPIDDDWDEIIANFDLSEIQAELLRQGISEIAADINQNLDFERREFDGRDRKETIKHFRKISKTLKKLDSLLSDEDQNSNRLLSDLYGRELAELLGNKGIEKLLPDFPGFDAPSMRDLESRNANSREGPYEALDDMHYVHEREQIARSTAHLLLQRLTRTLNQPLLRFLEIQRQTRGGNPGRRYRNYVIQQLAILFHRVFDKPPTRTTLGPIRNRAQQASTGQFIILCELVLTTFNMDTDGLENAVDRTLNRLKP